MILPAKLHLANQTLILALAMIDSRVEGKAFID